MNFKEKTIKHQYRNQHETSVNNTSVSTVDRSFGVYSFDGDTGKLSVTVTPPIDENIITNYPDREIRFIVNENLELMVIIPDNYDSIYDISLSDGYLIINRE